MTNDANIRLECLKPAERWAQPTGEEVREVLRLAGAGRLAVFVHATLPQVATQWLAYSLYRWENNIRAAAVLGVVGAGGLGQMLAFHLGLFQMSETSSILIAMILLVTMVDFGSYLLRRALMG